MLCDSLHVMVNPVKVTKFQFLLIYAKKIGYNVDEIGYNVAVIGQSLCNG